MIGPPSGEEVGGRIGIQQAAADEEEEEADFN